MPDPFPSRSTPPESSERRPYEPPRILVRESLEAMAAACVPSPPGKAAGFCSLASS